MKFLYFPVEKSMFMILIFNPFQDDPETLDLSNHGLTKLSRAAPGYELTTMTLLLDNNSLQRLDNIHTYQCLEKVRKIIKILLKSSRLYLDGPTFHLIVLEGGHLQIITSFSSYSFSILSFSFMYLTLCM